MQSLRTILLIIEKEFKQIFRNSMMAKIIVGMPILQLLVLSHAADYEVRNSTLYVDTQDYSAQVSSLINSINASPYFEVIGEGSYAEGFALMQGNDVDAVLSVPADFTQKLLKGKNPQVAVILDGVEGTKSNVASTYLEGLIVQWVQEYSHSQKGGDRSTAAQGILLAHRNWYNPTLNYKVFMVPGLLVLLITMIALFLSSMNIVKEKEEGTIEQINVTPIGKGEFVLGKLAPFVIIGLFEFTLGLSIAVLWFKVPVLGNLGTIYLFTFVYLTLVLGIGMLISTLTDTMQQAMFIAWFFAVIFILMSGLFTPLESMPLWAQRLTTLNPIKYYVEVIRLVLLKGSGFTHVWRQFISISLFSVAVNTLAIVNYKKSS